MKIKIIEMECTAEELRSSNSIAEGLQRILRNAFNPTPHSYEDDKEEIESEGE